MLRKTVPVGAAVGLHARPASLIAEEAAKYDAEITLTVEGDDPVDATSALLIMSLGAEHGTPVTIESTDSKAVEAISKLIESDLDAR